MSNMISTQDIDILKKNLLNFNTILNNKKIFLTGGTGFFGKWLLHSFIILNEILNVNIKVYILSRNPNKFLTDDPFFKKDYFKFIQGDITNFLENNNNLLYQKFDIIIHAATEASDKLNEENPLTMINTTVIGTRIMLDFAIQTSAKTFLLTSSGAIYGTQNPDITHISENNIGSVDCTNTLFAYHEGKRLSELLSCIYYKQYGLECKIARCFAFVGPYLPLNTHFAIGNFIQNVLNNKSIEIKGDGSPYRSYMYPTDLIEWLFTIMLHGKSAYPYNVGSDYDINLKNLANLISKLFNNININILKETNHFNKANRYVPNIERAKTDLQLNIKINLEDAILKTYNYYKGKNND